MHPDRIRLMIFNTVFAIGGTERQVVTLAKGLDRSRFDLHLGCSRRSGPFLEELERLDLPITEFSIKRLYGLRTLRQQLRLARYLRRHRIDVLHAYNFYSNVFAVPAARLAGVPVVLASIRDTGAYLSPAQCRVHRWACRLAHRVMANADAVKQWLISDGYDEEKITVVRNGIDQTRFKAGRGGSSVREGLGLPAGAPIVALLARVNPMKGVDDFLAAAAMVAARFAEARFLIVGGSAMARDGVLLSDVEYRRELDGVASRLGIGGRLVFAGHRLDIPDILSEVAVSVLPSLSEGLSNTLLESMAAGVPVVATRVGGNPEVVDEGVTGLLVPPRDPGALAGAICQVLGNPALAAQFGEAGRRRIAAHFSLEQMVRETQSVYERLLREVGTKRRLVGAWSGNL